MKNFWNALIRHDVDEFSEQSEVLHEPVDSSEVFPKYTHIVKASHRMAARQSFEIKQKIYFPKKEDEDAKVYHIDTWLFFPRALQVNASNYPAKSFLNKLKNYIRLRPPTAKLESIAELGGVLHKLEQALEHALQENNNETNQAYEQSLKLFCLIYKRSLGIATKAINILAPHEKEAATPHLLDEINKILTSYRNLREKTQKAAQNLRVPAYEYCDEYLATVTMFRLNQLMNNFPTGVDKLYLHEFIKHEMQYRLEHYPESVAQDQSDNEKPLYRWNVLKKYIAEPLFLDVRERKGENFVAQFIYGTAAALAMIFATAIVYIWQRRYGNLSNELFFAMVIGYIFKDRIKEITRNKMFTWLKRWVPDRRLLIFKNHKTPIGTCEEMFQFIDEKKLPDAIRSLRDRTHFVEIDNSYHSEDIFYYSKTLTINNTSGLFFSSQRSLMDITRLEMSDFLKHADDSNDEIIGKDEEQVVIGDKIYNINMLRRVSRGKKIEYERVRIVVNKAGIKRIEEIVALAPLEE